MNEEERHSRLMGIIKGQYPQQRALLDMMDDLLHERNELDRNLQVANQTISALTTKIYKLERRLNKET